MICGDPPVSDPDGSTREVALQAAWGDTKEPSRVLLVVANTLHQLAGAHARGPIKGPLVSCGGSTVLASSVSLSADVLPVSGRPLAGPSASACYPRPPPPRILKVFWVRTEKAPLNSAE